MDCIQYAVMLGVMNHPLPFRCICSCCQRDDMIREVATEKHTSKLWLMTVHPKDTLGAWSSMPTELLPL
eukprot:scaffold549591_cov28-Prasinocladus_malaysianus.AAC.1